MGFLAPEGRCDPMGIKYLFRERNIWRGHYSLFLVSLLLFLLLLSLLLLLFMSHLLAPPSCRTGPSPWLAPWYGMVSHWLSGHFSTEYSPRNSFSNLKQHYLAVLGLGALLSSLI